MGSNRFAPLVTLLLLCGAPTFAQTAVQRAARATTGAPARWDSGFAARGPAGRAHIVAVYDDGSGARAFFDDKTYHSFSPATIQLTTWSRRENGSQSFSVVPPCCDYERSIDAMLTYDDGSGPVLLVGGNFFGVLGGATGGGAAPGFAVWDGASWSAWPGPPAPGGGYVTAIAANGSDLVVAARPDVPTTAPRQVSRWTGTDWETLGAPVAGLEELAFSTAGGTPELYAVNGQSVLRFASTTWSVLPSPFTGPTTLTHFDSGAPLLVAGGATDELLAWDGTTWAPLGGVAGPIGVSDLAVARRDTSDALYACGSFDSIGGVPFGHVARWSGRAWTSLGSGTDRPPSSIATDPSSRAVFVAGDFKSAGGIAAPQVAKWDGARWHAFGTGQGVVYRDPFGSPRVAGTVDVLEKLDVGGPTPELFAGGRFSFAGSSPSPGLAMWKHGRWSPLGTGFEHVGALATFDDGAGPVLYAGGRLDTPSQTNLAWFDGASWNAVAGTNNTVTVLRSYDTGSGPMFYASGAFTTIGGVPAYRIARFDGASWSPITTIDIDGYVFAMTVFDDGSGPALVVGGDFDEIDGVTVNGIARFDGSTWSAMGTGFETENSYRHVATLEVLDVPALGGTRLLAGGSFLASKNGATLNGVAMWDGTDWTPVGSGFGPNSGRRTLVRGFAVFDEGYGPELVAAGDIVSLGPAFFQGIARFNGTDWNPIPDHTSTNVNALREVGGTLWVGAGGSKARGIVSVGIGRRYPAGPGERAMLGR